MWVDCRLANHNAVAMKRRDFLQTFVAALVASRSVLSRGADKQRPPRLLLRSSWQTVNIGDIAHTPGVLAILEKHLPGVEVRLWPSKVDNGVEEMLLARFPKLRIVKGAEALKVAFDECDFLLHGSGPSLVAEKDVARWSKETGKSYGIYGITLPLQGSTATSPAPDKVIEQTIAVLSRAKFVYFRDSASLELAKKRGCTCPVMEFGPDAAFGTDLRDDAKATAFLKANGLEEGRFLCCIPRLRFTPYWTIPSKNAPFDEKKHARNEAMKEHDHAPHRQAIIDVLRQTDLKVLICPEDQTQMAVGKELLYDPLPADVKSRAVWRPDYWLTGEALSTYRRSAGLFGNEMHSPIMCIGSGIPAIVCRWAEQTTKGLMWRDIGLGDWLFDFDKDEDCRRLPETVLALAKDLPAARAKAVKARAFVEQRQRETMQVLNESLKVT
jgi:polysaccharide pyruvyl transferase WcaK-like protein